MGSVEAGVPGASHYLALAVDASGDGGEIARQSAEVREYTVLPKRAILGGVVGAADCANNLALIVNALGDRASSEVRELGSRAVFPRYGVNGRTAAGSGVAYGLAFIVDLKCVPVPIDNHRDNSGSRVHSLFPVALVIETLWVTAIFRVTQVFCNNLKILCLRAAWLDAWCGSSEIAFIVH